MAFEIVDGMTGTKHISSDDLSALNIATIGKADCVLEYGDNFKLTMASANNATLGTGVGMVGGKRFWNQAATSLTVQSGTQGQKRNDLVVARYAKTSAGIESITPVVIKGTPSTGTAADPATTSNDLKLWRIPLDGISVGTPVKLFDPVASLSTLEDSISRKQIRIKEGVTCYIEGGMCIVSVDFLSVTSATTVVNIASLPDGLKPLGYIVAGSSGMNDHAYIAPIKYRGTNNDYFGQLMVTRGGMICAYVTHPGSYYYGQLVFPIAR